MNATEATDSVSSRAMDAVEHAAPGPVEPILHRLRDGDVFLYSGGLAFYALISLVPFLIVGFWLAGSIVGEERIEQTATRVAQIAPESIDIQPGVTALLETGTGVGFLAILAAIWPATAYGGGLVRALEAVAPGEAPPAHGLRGRARSLATLVFLPVFILGGVAGASLIPSPADVGTAELLALGAAAFVGGVAVTWLAIVGLYWWFGNAHLDWRSRIIGGGSAALAIGFMSLGYMVYLANGADWEERTVGSGLAAVVLLGLWLYLSNLLLLTGWVIGITTRHGSPDA